VHQQQFALHKAQEPGEARLALRRILPPPAGSTVYELTDLGQALEKGVLELRVCTRQIELEEAIARCLI
jgi:hypothetical protein